VVSEIYEILRVAAVRRQAVTAIYDGLPRLLCPHVSGRKSGRLHALFYQFGGSSNSGLPVTPEGVGDWRCLAVEKLSQVELSAEAWHTEPRSRRQTCVDEVDFDADDQPDEDPQQGQCGSCRSSRRARIIRSVAIEYGLCRSGRMRRSAGAEVRCWPGANESRITDAGRGGKTVPLGHQEPISCDA